MSESLIWGAVHLLFSSAGAATHSYAALKEEQLDCSHHPKTPKRVEPCSEERRKNEIGGMNGVENVTSDLG